MTRILCVLLLSSVLIAACGPEAVKPTADMERLASIRKLLDDASADYREGRIEGLLSRLPEDIDRSDPSLKPGLTRDVDRSGKRDLSFDIRWVRMMDDEATVTLHWTAVLTPSKGSPVEKKGTAIWTVRRPAPPRVIKMAGDSPFGLLPP